MHINVFELQATLYGLISLCNCICDSHIKIHSDNTTAVHCINNMGSCRSIDCDKIRMRIEWKLSRKIFHNMIEYFQYYLKIDLFPSRIDSQLLGLLRGMFKHKPSVFFYIVTYDVVKVLQYISNSYSQMSL